MGLLDQEDVTLVAVSKTKPKAMIQDLYDQGQRIFGENRVPELVDKAATLPEDIEWHMIGHLQRNKVRDIVPFVSMIHSVDSIRLLRKINAEAEAAGRTVDILLQFHIATEDSKYGLTDQDIDEVMAIVADADHVCARGVMGMATFTDDKEQVRKEFRKLKAIYDRLLLDYDMPSTFDTVSMGMSGDYELAIEEGSTMVRLGSLLFGAR